MFIIANGIRERERGIHKNSYYYPFRGRLYRAI